MAQKLWKKIDAGVFVANAPVHLAENDLCYYAMDYIPKGGYNAGDGNQQISNFKKDVSKRGTNQWPHKEKAIRRFALEIARTIPENSVLAPATTSKTDDDPEFDDRLIQTVKLAAKFDKTFRIEQPIGVIASQPSSHAGGTRNPRVIYDNLEWLGFDDEPPETLILVDDVISSGAHFKAYQRLLNEHHPDTELVGIFWARTVKPPCDDFDEIE